MGLSVPYMRRPGTIRLGGEEFISFAPKACHCTQCGAPHETHASMCAYCLSPKTGQRQNEWASYEFATVTAILSAEQRIAAMVEITTLEDRAPQFVPVMQDERFRT